MRHWVSVIVGKAGFDAPSARSEQPPQKQGVRTGQIPSELPRRRAEALRSFFPKLFSWFEDTFEGQRRREVEAFLSQATDIADLEHRIKQLQRQQFFSRYY